MLAILNHHLICQYNSCIRQAQYPHLVEKPTEACVIVIKQYF